MTKTRPPLTPEDALRKARELVPVLKERAAETEKARTVPEATIQAFADSGLFYILQPAKYGGYEHPMSSLIDVTMEFARVDASAAWVYSVLAGHFWLGGLFSGEVQDEMWGTNPDTLIATSVGGQGNELVPVDGGYRIKDAKWYFSSGCDYSEWEIFVGWVGNPENAHWCIVPRSDYDIIDNWYVAGLRGTGSKTVHVKDAFVPDHRVVPFFQMFLGQGPGGQVHSSPLYRMPVYSGFQNLLIGTPLGAAWGVMDGLIDRISSRGLPETPEAMADQAPLHLRIGEAAVKLETAQSLLGANNDEVMRWLSAGEQIPPPEVMHYALDYCYAAEMCAAAAEMLFLGAGGNALMDTNPIQRMWRDVHAAASHMAFNWDDFRLRVGRMVLSAAPEGANA